MLREEEMIAPKKRISELQQLGKLKPSPLLLGILERTNPSWSDNRRGTDRHLSRTKRKLARRKSLSSLRRKKQLAKRSMQMVS